MPNSYKCMTCPFAHFWVDLSGKKPKQMIECQYMEGDCIVKDLKIKDK